MDKKNKKKTVIKRKTGEETSAEDKKPKIDEMKCDNKIEVEVIDGQNEHQIVQASQLVEGNFEQQVFVNLKGEPVQLGPNTVIVYEQNTGTPSNFAFGGMWTMDQSGRIVMGDTVYDVKGEPEDDSGGTFVQNNTEITNVNESSGQFQQYEISNSNSTNTVDGNQHYQVSILEKDQQDNSNQHEETVVEQTESELDSQSTVRWLNQKYDILVRKLQMNYDAGVKLLHTQGGCIQCVYLTTPGMQMAFNAVPQFLCIDSSVEFTSILPGTNGSTGISHHVVLFLAEDGNGKSVIVSAGISPIQVHMNWLLETFKSCNPAWKSVRCIVAEPEKHIQCIKQCFPAVHVCPSVYQAVMYAWPSNRRDYTARLKQYALSLLRDNPTDHQKNQMRKQLSQVGSSVLNNLETVLETENYTNVLHKNLERLLTRFQNVTLTATQPEDFIASFFQIADQLEQERRNYAILRLRETESLKQSPTDTITQYAYNLMSHQTKLAQKCLDDKAGKRHSTAAICKYGTSTQECSCLFSKVFKLPCRHILMLTTELKVRTHIPFEPRWTVQHCLFGCETMQTTPGNNSEFIEQIVVENEQQQQQQQGVTGRQQQQQQQYVLATSSPAQSVPQVIFCSPAAGGTTSSVVPGTAVLAQHAIIPDNH